VVKSANTFKVSYSICIWNTNIFYSNKRTVRNWSLLHSDR